MAKKGGGKRGSTTGSLRRADADMSRDKAIAKARAKVEKRRRQLGDATTELAALEAAPSRARSAATRAQAATAQVPTAPSRSAAIAASPPGAKAKGTKP